METDQSPYLRKIKGPKNIVAHSLSRLGLKIILTSRKQETKFNFYKRQLMTIDDTLTSKKIMHNNLQLFKNISTNKKV